MPEFAYGDWLRELISHGEARFEAPPVFPESRVEETSILRAAHATACLHLPGPVLPFAEKTARAAARLTAMACWSYLRPPADAEPLPLPYKLDKSETAADHLAADLTLRYLVSVYRRSILRGTADPLAVHLGELFREWPLTGVLADLREPPTGDLNFGGSPALQMLYAERVIRFPRAAWVPQHGVARQRAELVFQKLGKVLPSRPAEKSPDD